jgi:DNA-binding transcriptional MerR regulator
MHIGDASRAVGRSADTLRRWEEQGLIIPDRDSRGLRVYSPAHIERCRQVANHAIEAMTSSRKLSRVVPTQLSLFGSEDV